jgi:NAD(P)-dependent dehydrogenase (short-subunit alcohol dehydrogenase family)
MPAPLQNKVALITGASRGLGAEIARALSAAGANVALCAAHDFSVAPADTKTTKHLADLSDPRVPDQLIGEVLAAHGRIDILVNNAAMQGPIGAFESVDFEQWSEVFAVNFFAAARLMQLVIPQMRANGGGKIINLSGGGATSPRPHVSAYGASKCALVRFTETLAIELKPYHIDVNAVAPGPMNTRMLDEVLNAGPNAAPLEFEAARQRKETGGASPEKAAGLVTFLASPASDGITGRLISAVWDDWKSLRAAELEGTDLYTLRRVTKYHGFPTRAHDTAGKQNPILPK